MGPILQERTSTIVKTVPVKERVKNSENSAIVTSTSKTTGKISQNLSHLKKASPLHKNVPSGQEKEPLPRAEINGQQRNRPKHAKSPNNATYKMLYTQFEVDIRHPRSKACPLEFKDKRHNMQRQPLCTGAGQNYAAQEKKRHTLSLPLSPYQVCLPENVQNLESFASWIKQKMTRTVPVTCQILRGFLYLLLRAPLLSSISEQKSLNQ
ncbi:hypothetical protein Baya_10967 [Bagarius yarrelli]|uniref:Uncharacterized protein n=1 Tax=Bagarius yarrelli TaxID=175774 RepID=A0A556UYJ0_BAGYA|nr:hypothetical protein Baya_10967 [Bagarius yarrelli]